MTMKSSNHVLIEWPMKKDHYDVDWPVVRKKLGNSTTDWLLGLDPTQGNVYIYHNVDTNKAQLVVEFYNDHTEHVFVKQVSRINNTCA